MKILVTLCLTLCLLIMPILVTEASGQVTNRIYLDHIEVIVTSTYTSNTKSYVAVRPILQADGWTMVWESSSKILRAVNQAGHRIVLTLDSNKATVNNKSITLGAKVSMREGSIHLAADDLALVLDKEISTTVNSNNIYFKSTLKEDIYKALNDTKSTYTYDGKLVENKRSGVGKLFKNGQLIYDGDFSENKLEGYGKLYLSGKLAVEGGFKDNEPHGHAVYDMSNGEVYDGAFLKGRMTGEGKLYRGKTLLYDGAWLNEKMSGVGQVYDAAGEIVYAGEIKNNARDGFGIQYANGKKKYQGYWYKGLMQGEGKLFDRNGEITFIGSFVNNQKEGTGTAVSFKLRPWVSEGPNHTWITEQLDTANMDMGEYKNDKLIDSRENSTWYTGQYNSDKIPNGIGKFYRSTGTFNLQSGILADVELYYSGEVKAGKMHGLGKAYKAGELIYDGEYAADLRHGKGKEYKDGLLVYYGDWKNERRSGNGKSFEYKANISRFSGRNTAIITEGEFLLGQLRTTKAVYKYMGTFTNGAITGSGNLYVLDATSTVSYDLQSGTHAYYGEYKDGLRHGEGIVYSKNLVKQFEGTYFNDLREGAGKEYTNGLITYDGFYLNDMRDGFGRLYENYGLVYEGYFKENKKYGYGKEYKNGILIFEGDFINDVHQK